MRPGAFACQGFAAELAADLFGSQVAGPGVVVAVQESAVLATAEIVVM